MKSMTKLMVVAMILVAALVVAPVAARDPAVNSTIFIGEENLNVAAFAPGDTRLVHYSSVQDRAVDDEIVVTGGIITEAKKGIKTGNYYVDDGLANKYLNVRSPEATLDVRLNATNPVDSVAGKSVTRNTELVFRLANNLIPLPSPNGNMRIEVTLPGGGVVTQVGNATNTVNVGNIAANGTTAITAPFTLSSAGTYTAQAKWPRGTDFFGEGFDSNTVTFEVATKALAITSNKDSVVRGNSFSVTITGESRVQYRVWITPTGSASPSMPDSQTAFSAIQPAGSDSQNRTVTTNAGGTATVQFNTNTSTEARSYTVNVEKVGDIGTNDDVRVRVEEGAVTVTASGTGVYYIGEEVTLSGTCTDNESTVHLFLTGPNLNDAGVRLDNVASAVVLNDTSSFFTANVEADDTWSKKWDTNAIAGSLDAGGYTIYAASKPVTKNDLSKAKYATVSVQLRSGFVTATTSGATVAKGDDLTLTGTAQGNPDDGLQVWIFGKNYYGARGAVNVIPVTLETDGSFEEDIDTDGLASGQYFVVVQHPMTGGFGVQHGVMAGQNPNAIYRLGATPAAGTTEFVANLVGLQASEAANALITALDSPYVDDTYVKLTFVVEEPQIFIDPIGDKAAGSKFTITGTTNLAVGDALNIEVTSAAFQPTTKDTASGFASVAGTTEIQQGDGANTWSFEVDGASFKPDQYIVRVESIDTGTTSTANFNVVEAVATTQPAQTTTATGTATTTTTTTTTTAIPTTTPGFGALLALAGLGAVAFLVLRRD